MAARLTAKLKPEQPIYRIAPKPFAEQKKISKPGEYQYVLKQARAETKGETMVTKVHDKPTPEEKGKSRKDDVQEPRGPKLVVKDQLKTPEKKVRFVGETSTIPNKKQWTCQHKDSNQGSGGSRKEPCNRSGYERKGSKAFQ